MKYEDRERTGWRRCLRHPLWSNRLYVVSTVYEENFLKPLTFSGEIRLLCDVDESVDVEVHGEMISFA